MRLEPESFALMFFSSYGTSLRTWDGAGMLSRETEYLRMLQDRLGPAALMSYGGGMGEEVLAEEGGLAALKGRPSWAPMPLYSVLAPLIHRRSMRASDVYRTSQLRGAWTAALASMLHRKALVVRTGYVWSQFNRAGGGSGMRLRLVNMLERFALKRADIVIAASEADRDSLISLHGLDAERVHVAPNPVDTRLFRPDPKIKREPGLITFIGRLEPQKGLDKLIDALDKAPRARLRIIGNGSERLALTKLAANRKVEFLGMVANEKLPALLRESEGFVLPSAYEGTPKALLEAMACAIPVIAARSEGSAGVITDGVNGLLAERTADGLARSINALLRDTDLRTRLSIAGWRYVNERHSMQAVADLEADLIRQAAEMRGVRLATYEDAAIEEPESYDRAA
jgi:glycosyltransferase involved in cell wall biosynthesis